MTTEEKAEIYTEIDKAFEADTSGALTKLRIQLKRIVAGMPETESTASNVVELAIKFHYDENSEEVIQQIIKNTTGISDFIVIRNSTGDFIIQSESTWVTQLQVFVSVANAMVIPRYATPNSTDIQILSVDAQGNWMDEQVEYSVLVIKNIE